MTDEYKKNVLDWLTHNYVMESGDDTPQFSDTITVQNNIHDFIYQYTEPASPSYKKYIQIEGFDMYALIGWYDAEKYFIVILDRNLIPIQFIDSYSSGVKFQKIVDINYDSENNFFLLEYVEEDSEDRLRFVMLNNIFTLNKDSKYEVDIVKSYTIPNDLLLSGEIQSSNGFGIYKNPGQSRYLMFLEYLNAPLVVDLTVNVGSNNEWKVYRAPRGMYSSFMEGCAYYDFGESLTIIIPFVDDSDFLYKEFVYQNESLVIDESKTVALPKDADQNYVYGGNAVKINAISSYVAYRAKNITQNTNEKNYVIKITNNQSVILDEMSSDIEDWTANLIYNYFYRYQNQFFLRIKICSDDTEDDIYYVCLLDDDKFYKSPIGPLPEPIWNAPFFVTNAYKMYSFYVQIDNVLYSKNLIYSSNDYNGKPYNQLNSMIPNSANLYDSSGKLLLSRNLYNLSIYDNTTIATLQIPNNILNMNQIANEQLVGQTNQTLVDSNKTISKNVYEELFLNFNNQINVIDNNNQSRIINQLAANRLNSSISREKDYDDASIYYAVVNYSDGTSSNVELGIGQYDTTGFIYTFNFAIAVPIDKDVISINLSSKDLRTVYQTISNLNLERGKMYSIKQNVRIE